MKFILKWLTVILFIDLSFSAANMSEPVRWILEPKDIFLAKGANARVECKADGFPKPQVTWKKSVGGAYEDLHFGTNIRIEEGTLCIDNIQKNNQGFYLCEVTNLIGPGLKAPIVVIVQAPPEIAEPDRNQTAQRSGSATFQCAVEGDKPILVSWYSNHTPLNQLYQNGYTIYEEIVSTGIVSRVNIKRTQRTDTSLFTCVATNAFGSDNSSINMIIQEVPEMPFAVRVLDKAGRSVRLSWAKPYDGNSPINRYIIEFKRSRGTWEQDVDRVTVPGDTNEAQIQYLSPTTTYHIQIIAENEIGVSHSSELVTIITAEEIPSGKPQAIKVEPMSQTALRVTWKPPARNDWNGEIIGYYVGYKQTNTNSSFAFETVNFPMEEEDKEHSLELNNLKTYTQYSVVIQTFNKVGAGPMSDEEKQHTAEGPPDQAPSDTSCTTLTSQTIRVSWVSPPLESANGVIKGYKVFYVPSELWYYDTNKDYKKTGESETVLHGLKKYTNYTVQILATTSGGDGVKSREIHCQTDQDVPGAPTDVKALVMSSEAILVSWRQPAQPNGIILQYTVYYKPEDSYAIPASIRATSNQMKYEVSGLKNNKSYEFWITASTIVGEGSASEVVMAMTNNNAPTRIGSSNEILMVNLKSEIILPCVSVGSPTPVVSWRIKGEEFAATERIIQLPNGSLFIKEVRQNDAGEYTCNLENSLTYDSITHMLIINEPPQSPVLTLLGITTNSLTLKLKRHYDDSTRLLGYVLHYKPDFGDWETVEVTAETQIYTIENLYCGSRYQIFATSNNNVGTSEASDIIITSTVGSKPLIPNKLRFIVVQSDSVTIHMGAWEDGGCPISYFVVENKPKDLLEWDLLSNNLKPNSNFNILDLEPATWYNLRVVAHNSAGSSVAEYEYST